jgi:hypothetical protein
MWWGTSPPQPVYHQSLDDPRWAGTTEITYGDGIGEKAAFRVLHDTSYVYLSWRSLVAPASSPDQNTLYVGYRSSGGGDVIIRLSLTDLSPAVASAAPLAFEVFSRNADGTEGGPLTAPAELSSTVRVWVDPTPPGSWAVQFRLPITAFETTCGRFKLWYELLAGTPTEPVTSYTWPRAGAEIDGGTVADPHPANYPDPAVWQWFRPSQGTADRGCPVAGVSLSWSDIGTNNSPASHIEYRASAPFPINTFFARPTNFSGAPIPAGSITASFRLANWGSVPGDWEAGVSVDTLWAPIPGGANVPLSGAIPNNATADASNEVHFDWTVEDPDLSAFLNGDRRSHQCMLAELKSVAAPGVTFTNASVYRNMDVVSASSFRRDAVLSVKGLTPLSTQPRDVYIYVETHNLPARVSTKAPYTSIAGGGTPNQEAAREGQPTYRVHVYHDTGKTVMSGGQNRPVLSYQTSFAYTVTHEGELEGWRHRIDGPGLVELAPGWYKIPVPNQGSTTVTTRIEAVEPSRWSLSLHFGINRPLGGARHHYVGRTGGGIDLEYRARPNFALELFLGRDTLADKVGVTDLVATHLSLSGKAHLSSGTVRPFVEAGVGAYDLDPGSCRAGVHAGFGGLLAVGSRLALEVTLNSHIVDSGGDRLRFATAQVGVRLRL